MPSDATQPSARVLVGPSGWSYPDWAGIVYPRHAGKRFDALAFIARYFDAVEVNTSFYRIPSPRMVDSWVHRVADRPLRFAFKLTQTFTHERGDYTQTDVQAYHEAVEPVAAAGRLGAVLVQFPWSFRRTPEALDWIRRLHGDFGQLPLAVEVRHTSWDVPDTPAELTAMGVALCNIDQPLLHDCIGPSAHRTAPLAYFRFHGRRRDTWFAQNIKPFERYDYLYTPAELAEWIPRIREVAQTASEVFVFTNNHYRGQGPANALQLRAILEGRKISVPSELEAEFLDLRNVQSDPDADAFPTSLFA